MTTKNVAYLQNNGPSSNDDLPTTVESHHRAAGVQTFTLSGNHGDAAKMGGRPTTIYFLAEHTKAEVLRTFLDANPSLVEAKPRHGLHRLIKGHGHEWLEAARDMTSDYYDIGTSDSSGSSYTQEQVCGFCGELITGSYPHHLAGDCEETA